MEGLPGWDHDRAMPDRTFFKASALSRMKEPPPIPPTPVPPPSEVREEEHNAEGFPGERRHDAEAASPIHTTGDVAASSPPPVPVLDMVSVAELSGASLSRSSRSSSAPSKDVLPAASLSARASIHCGADDGPSSEAAADAALQDSKFVSPSNKTSAKPLSQMSMMERQEYWMNKKKLAIEAQRAEKEKENSNFSFKPNTGNSKRTYKAGENVRAIPSNPEMAVAVAARERTGPTESKTGGGVVRGSSGSKWGSLRAKVKGGEINKRKSKGAVKAKAAPGTADKAKKSSALEKQPAKEPLATAMSIARAASTELLATQPIAKNTDEVKGDAPEEPDSNAEKGGAKPQANELVESAADEAFDPGSFWWKVEGGRGHHRVRDGSDFQMWSIYRKKDKSKDVKGVSILVGRLEQPPYEEQVIQIMWDVEEWTEEVASNWWKENSYRYHGAASADSGKLIVTSGYTSGR